jgi:hypothetical protein
VDTSSIKRKFTPIKIDNEYLAESDSSTNFISSIESEIEALRAKRMAVVVDEDEFDFSNEIKAPVF